MYSLALTDYFHVFYLFAEVLTEFINISFKSSEYFYDQEFELFIRHIAYLCFIYLLFCDFFFLFFIWNIVLCFFISFIFLCLFLCIRSAISPGLGK